MLAQAYLSQFLLKAAGQQALQLLQLLADEQSIDKTKNTVITEATGSDPSNGVYALDHVKLTKITERLSGLKGDQGIESGTHSIDIWKQWREEKTDDVKHTHRKSPAHTPFPAPPPALSSRTFCLCFPGSVCIDWLCSSGLSDSRRTSTYICNRMLSSGYVVGVTAAGENRFYDTHTLLYRFAGDFSWNDTISSHDMDRLSLKKHDYIKIIHQLSAYYNNKVTKKPVIHSSVKLLSSVSSLLLRNRSTISSIDEFMGVEWVRWCKKKQLCKSAKEALIMGNYAIQQNLIKEVEHVSHSESQNSSNTITHSHTRTSKRQDNRSVFRCAEIWYSIVPKTEHLHNKQIQEKQPAQLGVVQSTEKGEQQHLSASGLFIPSSGSSSSVGSVTPTATVGDLPHNTSAISVPHVLDIELESAASDALSAALLSTPSLLRRSVAVIDPGSAATADGATTHDHTGGSNLCKWEFVQSFGDDSSGYDFNDADDLVTAVEFHPTGAYLAIGDKAGRVSIVQQSTNGTNDSGNADTTTPSPLEYKFFTEFQSHEPEFDCLRSCELSPRISVCEWYRYQTNQMSLFTANDKTIKLWRLPTQHLQQNKQQPAKNKQKQQTPTSTLSSAHEPTTISSTAPQSTLMTDSTAAAEEDFPCVSARCVSCYRNAHHYSIHSVSTSSDGQAFLSADELRILIWNIEYTHTAHLTYDLTHNQPFNHSINSVDELLTVARFHPSDPSLICIGSSKGIIRIADTRIHACADQNTQETFNNSHKHNRQKWKYGNSGNNNSSNGVADSTENTWSELTDSILDVHWSMHGSYLLSRDFGMCKLWDSRYPTHPVYASHIHPRCAAQQQMNLLLENEAIFDAFTCALSPDGTQFVTGSYSNCFTLHDMKKQETTTIKAKDDAREANVIEIFTNKQFYQQHKLQTTIDPTSQNTSHVSRLSSLLSFVPSVVSVLPLSKPKSPNFDKKMLKVAWHPHLDAVAVAGLYKLYLYQNRNNNKQ